MITLTILCILAITILVLWLIFRFISRDKIIPYYREEEEYKPPEVWNTYREDIHKRS